MLVECRRTQRKVSLPRCGVRACDGVNILFFPFRIDKTRCSRLNPSVANS